MIALIPFPWISRHLGELHSATSKQDHLGDLQRSDAGAREIGWAVAVAARALPIQMVCLPRALAVRGMMRRRGIAGRLHFGAVRKRETETRELVTHAWVDAFGVEVSGYPEARDCVEIGFYTV